MGVRRWAAAWVAAGVGVAALAVPVGPGVAAAATATRPTAHGSVGQAYIVGTTPGTHLILVDGSGRTVGRGTTDALGSLIVRNVAAGSGYSFRQVTPGTPGSHATASSFRVLAPTDTPAASFYAGQHLHEGINYVTMRDGVQLAVTVRLPLGKTMADGPFPTVIEDSGYATAGPHSLVDAVLHRNGETTSDPLLPSTSTVVGSLVAPLLGFAAISMQMRGSGCSGGAFDLFGLPTTYDGYDVVQIAAAQPWVAHHKVGLVGISFSGISQLFVAGTHPPGLAAVAPMSLTDDLYSTGFPGGMYNSGFAGTWLADRISDAKPAATWSDGHLVPLGTSPVKGVGQPWVYAETAAELAASGNGTSACLADQALHGQAQDISGLLHQASHRDPALYAQRAPVTWAAKTTVPVFLSGAIQDEQTGGQWPAVIQALSGDPNVWVTLTNGTHIESLGPGTISRWLAFLDIFVAQQVPKPSALLDVMAPLLYGQLAGAPSGKPPAIPYTDAKDVTAARAAFVKQPRIRVLMDNGAGSVGPGAFQPVWQLQYSAWPPPPAVPTTYRFGPGGTLTTGRLSASTVSFRPDPAARPAVSLPSGSPWVALPAYRWAPVTGPSGLGFTSAPLAHDVTVVGPASVDLWVKSSAPDTDLQATITEVRPDGQEMLVNTGQLRASDRALDTKASTALHPVPTYLASTATPLPAGKLTLVRIPVNPLAYSFRSGSRIRVTITAPGGDRPTWTFVTPATGGSVTDTLGLGGAAASALVLPVVPGVVPADTQPACPSLRGEPCRTYVAAQNGG